MSQGHCLCGAVRITATARENVISACHCAMCRRWNGAVFFEFEAAPDRVAVEGPVKTYASSAFAERAWCETCGTHLWFREHGADYELSPGLFEAAESFPLVREVYADRALRCAAMSGGHRRVSRDEYERDHPFVEDTP